MNKKIYKSAIRWKDEYCDILHCEVKDFSDIPHECVKKIHGVCFNDGKMLVVYHEKWNVWGIPGGTKEGDESAIKTLEREIYEESACRLVNAHPFAYQEVTHSDGSSYYSLLYHCEVEADGDFEKDIAGSITKISWIQPETYEEYLEEKTFRRVVVQSALDFRGTLGL